MRRAILLLSIGSVLWAQSVYDLKRKYGNPTSETFTVRPGVGVTIRRAPDGTVAEMLIAPVAQTLMESRQLTLSEDVVRSVLDELVPGLRRGKPTGSGFVNAICWPENNCSGKAEGYENVGFVFNAATAPEKFRYVDVQIKK